MTHGDPKNPKKNPHPIKRYEVTATADAPGPWDVVKGYLSFKVSNVTCVPQGSLTGARNVPITDFDFEMKRVDEKTWKGYFYRDFLQDEDYFGLGICHWDTSGVGAEFIAHSVSFSSTDVLDVFLRNGSQAEYFKKSDYLNHSLAGDGALVSSVDTPEVIQHPENFFPIMVTVKEATP
jgi:hypothetical protein